MKKIVLILGIIFCGTTALNAQILSNGSIDPAISGSNVMLDGSTAFSDEAGAGADVGKGVIIPSVDLVNFEFDLSMADGFTFPTFFDGMIVYNNSTGATLTTGNRPSTAVNVSPGFYYFYNPTGSMDFDIVNGVWKSMGGSGSKTIVDTNESESNLSVDGEPVYVIKGSFTVDGTTTKATIPSPTGMTGLYGITIYKSGSGTVYSRDLFRYTLDDAPVEPNAVTGSALMAVVYPAGTYDYVIEYFK